MEYAPQSARVYFNFATHLARRHDDPQRVMALYRRAIELGPDLAPAHNALGQVHYFSGDPGEARRHLSKAVDLDPRITDAWRSLIEIESQDGRFAAARQWCDRARGQQIFLPDLCPEHPGRADPHKGK